jgi:Family of unknown function (DUF6535)
MSEENSDFDDGAHKLWSLYVDIAKRHDEARIRVLKDDMYTYVNTFHCFQLIDRPWFISFLFQAGLLSVVIAAFVVPKLDVLQVNSAKQSVYYQLQQSAEMLAQISQQIPSIGTQIPLKSTHVFPHPTFQPSASDRRVTVFWLVSLLCSLSAALLSAIVRQWVRDYMNVDERPRKDLKKARIRDFLFEDIELLPVLAEAAFGLASSLVLWTLS